MGQPITTEQLSQFSLFKSIADEALKDLSAKCEQRVLKAGETLFQQGESADNLYLVEEGEVALIRRYENVDEIVLTRVGPNEVIGELSMITNEDRTASGIAIQDSRLIMLDRDTLFQYLNNFPGVATELMVHIAKRLRETTLLVREWGLDNAEARLASVILFLAEEDGHIKHGLISNNVRPRKLARAAGVDMKWLKETLDEWAFEGYIGVDGRRLLLHDSSALVAIAGWK